MDKKDQFERDPTIFQINLQNPPFQIPFFIERKNIKELNTPFVFDYAKWQDFEQVIIIPVPGLLKQIEFHPWTDRMDLSRAIL